MSEGILIESISQQAFEQVDNFKNKLVEGMNVTIEWAKELRKVQLPSQLKDQYTQTQTAISKTKKTVSDYEKQVRSLENAQKKRMQVTNKVNKDTVKLRFETTKLNRTQRLQAQLTSVLSSAYDKLDAKLSITANEYRNLAIRKEIGLRLTEKEERRMALLEKRVIKYHKALSNVDQKMGRFGRNVGNYGSAFNGLNFAMANITREAPAFAISMQTGFLAISNNIPILTDEINKLKIANRQLAAEGKPVVSVLGKIAKSIFSWQTLISLAVTLLTVFGSKLVDMAFGMTKAEKATDKANKEIAEQNKLLEDNIRLRKKQLGEATKFIDAQGEALRNALVQNQGETIKQGLILIEISERLGEIGVENADVLKNEDIAQQDRVVIANNLLEIERLKVKLQEERIRLGKVMAEEEKIQKQFEEGKISLAQKNNLLLFTGNNSIKNTLGIQERIQQLLGANATLTGNIVELTNQENGNRAKTVLILREYLEQVIAVAKRGEELTEITKKLVDETLKLGVDTSGLEKENELLQKQNAERLKKQQFIETERQLIKDAFIDFGSVLGLSEQTIGDLFDSMVHGFTDAGEAAQQFSALFNEVINGMAARENERINQRIEQLGQEKEIALAFAGESSAARENIERRHQEEVSRLKSKQAKNTQDAAVATSIINTAAAVIKTFAELGFPAGIPAAAIVGALGAAKTAIIASTPIPQFEKGVRNFKGGTAMINEKRNEVVTTPDGKIMRPTGRNLLVNLPEGSNVYKSESDFNRELNRTLDINGINPIGSVITSSPLHPGYGRNANISEAGMRRALAATFGSMKIHQTTFDKRGFTNYSIDQMQKRINLNNRVTQRGINV